MGIVEGGCVGWLGADERVVIVVVVDGWRVDVRVRERWRMSVLLVRYSGCCGCTGR